MQNGASNTLPSTDITFRPVVGVADNLGLRHTLKPGSRPLDSADLETHLILRGPPQGAGGFHPLVGGATPSARSNTV